MITKQYASAFFGTSLASTLTAMGVDTLLIAGVSTSGCIRATALDARARAALLPRYLRTQIFGALLENSASEQGASMTAMDNATRNAGELINKLTIQYNRSRQAAITTELIEIIAGAEAL